jgi:hypothetical protein
MKYQMKATLWERFREFMGWHNPIDISGSDGCSFQSKCKLCGEELLMDSQGNWF